MTPGTDDAPRVKGEPTVTRRDFIAALDRVVDELAAIFDLKPEQIATLKNVVR